MPLDDTVEAGVLLEGDDLLAGAPVGVDDVVALVARDEVALLVALQVGQLVLGPVRQREQARSRRDYLCHYARL